jgi:hypothetical protein
LIFPALWEYFGKPNGCTGIVAMCHSMAVPGAIIAATLYSQDAAPKYPPAGLILSVYGTQRVDRTKELSPPPGTPPPGRDFGFVPEVKQVLMLSDRKLNCYDLEVVKQMPVQDHNMMTDELTDLNALWLTYWKKYADEAKGADFVFAGRARLVVAWKQGACARFHGVFPEKRENRRRYCCGRAAHAGVVVGQYRMVCEVLWMGH